MPGAGQDHNRRHRSRVVVVGPCASGKSTLVTRLVAAGVDARVSGQEHSAVRDLWKRLEPDFLVALDVDLDTIRERRTPTWPEQIYRTQRLRLKGAFDAADIVIDTRQASAEAVAGEVLDALGLKPPANDHDAPGDYQ